MQDPVEVQLPGSDRHRIGLRMEESRDRITPTPFHDPSLYFCNSPVIIVGGRTRNVSQWFNSRRQLIYRVAHGLTELVQSPSVHPPVEGSADGGTG